ncbi:PH and SEC7 domain-containing protein C11E3,11c [Schizosaccharomyces pombe 972h-] [Rhizoctonia solani]|uniref:PH and SEC7 domain-containing protein C11E3,11c [Schizosaccharomyces pombe 972h-] n=1 Tax=Rhizoctonia solani TaxID=456999 RepID=A0A0K6FMG8_9AGAM|nr:PH and SEC7 domain-containing protein C11E3,11c [Schizosaccharomyces pombe 972h-] [Rhizoctonia solani]
MALSALASWNTKLGMRLNPNFSKSSVNVAVIPENMSSPVYYDAPTRVQGTASELNLDQSKLQRLKSKPSRLERGNTKSPSNASGDSFYTPSAGSNASQRSHIEDPPQVIPEQEDNAKAFAERAWREDPGFVEREKLVEWLGSPLEIRHQALAYYIAHFDFTGSEIDEAIRQLCNKLYIKGETQQIDRVLEAFSEHYISQNSGSLWQVSDIVHVVSFAIILLNTDLQAAELNSHITSSRFVENTVEAVRTQLQQEASNSSISNDPQTPEPLADIDEAGQLHSPTTPSVVGPHSSINRRPSNRTNRISSTGSLGPGGRDSWVMTGPSDAGEPRFGERWYSEISRELSAIYNRVRVKPILQTRQDEATASPQSKPNTGLLKRGSAKLYNSLRGESPYGQASSSASGTSFISALGHRMSSSMSSLPLPPFMGVTSNQSLQSSASNDPSKSADSRWAKTGPLLWKSMKPTAGRIAKPKRWVSVVANVRSSIFDMNSPTPPGSNTATGRRVGSLSLLHTLAIEIPAPKGSKVRSFGLTISSGETHVFEIQASGGLFGKSKKSGPDADAEVLAWVRACNYHAARYSRAPLPDAVTNVEYGWNGVADLDDDQGSINGWNRNVLIDDWAAPNLPAMEAETDAETQLDAWDRQVKMCNAEFAEHGELRGKMMSLYRPGSVQAQKALANWEKKAQYLLTEIFKYETYAEILKNTELAPQQST